MRQAGADQAANERMGRTGWQTPVPGQDVPGARPDQRSCNDPICYILWVRIKYALADRCGHAQVEKEKRNEVEESCPDHRLLRAEYARRDNGSDGVGRVVQAVQEIEDERQ